MAESNAALLAQVFVVAAVVLAAVVINWLVKRIIVRSVKSFVSRTETRYDDFFLQYHVFDRLSHLAPALVLYGAAPWALPHSPNAQDLVRRFSMAYMIVVGTMSVSGLLNTLAAAYQTLAISKHRPIKSYVQVVKLVIYMITAVVVASMLIDRSPWVFLSGMGALTAVLLLVFKDTILGLVASVQITSNDMVRIGDWIEMPKAGADGDVIDINLTTVKVQNWDKTITTIPTYELIASSFKNWRGMSESGGRRIKRAIHIDMSTVKFCKEATLERFRRMTLLRPYLDEKLNEIRQYNEDSKVDLDEIVNGRRLTNLGTFRAYVIAFLKQHPKVNKNMTFLVRHLAPGAEGLPIEVYVFSSDKVWANYEAIQADIFDHLLAVVPEFDLRVFQHPSGGDIASASRALMPAPSPSPTTSSTSATPQ